MLSSITPLGERGRGRRWRTTAMAYVIGSVAGGAVLGALLGGVGALVASLVDVPAAAVGAGVAVLCATGIALDLRVLGRRLPTIRRQVDENWLGAYRGWVVGAGFGLQLGLGVVTIVTTSAVYVALALAALTSSVFGGLFVGTVFGLVRALPILAVRGVRSTGDLVAVHRRMSQWAPLAHRAALGLQGLLAVGAVAVTLA